MKRYSATAKFAWLTRPPARRLSDDRALGWLMMVNQNTTRSNGKILLNDQARLISLAFLCERLEMLQFLLEARFNAVLLIIRSPMLDRRGTRLPQDPFAKPRGRVTVGAAEMTEAYIQDQPRFTQILGPRSAWACAISFAKSAVKTLGRVSPWRQGNDRGMHTRITKISSNPRAKAGPRVAQARVTP
jgi:hypothetical protein